MEHLLSSRIYVRRIIWQVEEEVDEMRTWTFERETPTGVLRNAMLICKQYQTKKRENKNKQRRWW